MNINEKFHLAVEQYQKGNLRQAEIICREILKIKSDDADVMVFLGIILYELGNIDSAMIFFKKALQFDPSNKDFYKAQGIILPEKGQFDEAQRKRFDEVSDRYTSLVEQLYGSMTNSTINYKDGYGWINHCVSIREAFKNRVPFGFFHQENIAYTMVYTGNLANQFKYDLVLREFGEKQSELLIEEDEVGLPILLPEFHHTSAHRLLHSSHLAFYKSITKKNISDNSIIIEWGGGYGNMARILRRLHPNLTYVLVDLPELGALQYIYLYSVTGEFPHILTKDEEIKSQNINIVSSYAVVKGDVKLEGSAFISTWALTESFEEYQRFVVNEQFFGSDNLLLGYSADSHNYIRDELMRRGCFIIPINYLNYGHEYAFK
jgi:tetratricopeptide (TPR) repeat protein